MAILLQPLPLPTLTLAKPLPKETATKKSSTAPVSIFLVLSHITLPSILPKFCSLLFIVQLFSTLSFRCSWSNDYLWTAWSRTHCDCYAMLLAEGVNATHSHKSLPKWSGGSQILGAGFTRTAWATFMKKQLKNLAHDKVSPTRDGAYRVKTHSFLNQGERQARTQCTFYFKTMWKQ